MFPTRAVDGCGYYLTVWALHGRSRVWLSDDGYAQATLHMDRGVKQDWRARLAREASARGMLYSPEDGTLTSEYVGDARRLEAAAERFAAKVVRVIEKVLA